MPVQVSEPETFDSKYDNTHFSFEDKEEVNFYLLADIFEYDFPNFRLHFSIGDVIIYIGFISTVIFAGFRIHELWRDRN